MTAAPPQPRQLSLALASVMAKGCRVHELTTLRDFFPGGRMPVQFFLDQIDNGDIRWAFNIARRDSRREVRIWWSEVQSILTGEPLASNDPKLLGLVIADILPPLRNRPAQLVTVTGAELQRCLGCGHQLVNELIDDGEFGAPVNPAARPVSAVVTYNAAVAFLRRRKL